MRHIAAGERVSVEELDTSVVELYVQDRRAKCEEIFIPFKILSKRKKVSFFLVVWVVYFYKIILGSVMLKFLQMETLVLEGDSPATVLLRYVTDSAVSSLVMGSSSPGYFSRYGQMIPLALVQCTYFVVCGWHYNFSATFYLRPCSSNFCFLSNHYLKLSYLFIFVLAIKSSTENILIFHL